MKRKFLCLLLTLALVLGLAATASAYDDRITSGDWVYEIVEGKAVLCSYIGTDTDVVVPAKIDGYAVSEVGPGFFCAFGKVQETMKSVTLSEGIQRINTNAFANCTALERAYIPGSVRTISSSAFEGCTALYDVTFSEGLKSIGRYAFLNTALTSVVIPASVTTIDEDSIGYTGEWGDTEQVDGFGIFGWSDTAAEEYAWDWHFSFYRLEDMTDTSGRCGDNAAWRFEASTGTLYIEGEEDTDPYYNGIQPWIAYADSIRRVVIGEGISHLGDNSFAYHYPNLTEVVLPDSMMSLGNGAFQGCSGLSKCDFPLNLSYFGGSTFRGTALKEVVFSADMKRAPNIGGYCFADCPELTFVKFPTSFDYTSDGIFANCPKLFQVDMSGMTYSGSVGDKMFYNCDSLTNIDFHTISDITPGMYQDCDGLRDITIPAGVTYLHTDAFEGCDNLSNVVFTGDVPAYNSNVFRGCTLTAWYPADNATWTENHFHSHGGTITWKPYDGLAFSDVLPCHFCYTPVDWAVENQITNGISDTEFGPGAVCNRAQIVTFLWRAAGSPEPAAVENPFVDVEAGSFYEKAVLWAVEKGITTGTDATHFSPASPCNRATVVTFLYRAFENPAVENGENPFNDVPANDWYTAPVLWAVEKGITNGLSATEFGPASLCNRAQIVTFLYRAKDIEPAVRYSFELRSNDPTEEIGFAFCEGTEFAAGESVIFYAEPWFGYLVEFEAEPNVELELYYLGAYTYELVMPAHDLVLTANFVPAPGESHGITLDCENGFAFAVCDADENGSSFAKAGEFIQIFIIPEEGFTFSPESFTATANGQPVENWWYLGEIVEEDPELGVIDGIFAIELIMPDADLTVSVTCTPGADTAAAEVRLPVTVR